MHGRSDSRPIVVLQPDPALKDERFEAFAGSWSGLCLDAEQPDAADAGDRHRVARGHARYQHRISPKNCRGCQEPHDHFLHTTSE
jgi:hypothetical protein